MKQNLMEFGNLPEMILKNKFVLMKNVPFKRKAQGSLLFLHDLFCWHFYKNIFYFCKQSFIKLNVWKLPFLAEVEKIMEVKAT